MTRTGHSRAGDGPSHDERSSAVWARATDGFNRWTAGDPAGLDDLVAVMTPVLWHVVRAYRLSDSAAEDVIQNTWLALVRRRAAILDPVAVGGWLTTTARREAWRTAGAKTTPTPVEDDDLEHVLPQQRSAEESVVQHDDGDRLWAAVDGLPERCRRLLRIVAFENRPDYRELATELGMPVGSIGPTRGRCLAKLRVALIEAGEV
ncbi:sigma-70 family RNA polymerase sigma factor [Nocardioides sp. YIM 152315]|uniref:RNA polymerase sigma factor n=1 Tax=Nocardioides sp. YIM 152315 TaxID=3031760 RepID=UPI0023DA0A03|nr:sigma-70 family RNA polymerase sigma factor [Nocardioides sp. YIM 152315]MDF1604434.1 sigma-70 family RNA polymerase sigma factor [Nocardioides sp. YIM 152315]